MLANMLTSTQSSGSGSADVFPTPTVAGDETGAVFVGG
jgi:hypothetical protein